jgi:hypothetical protein
MFGRHLRTNVELYVAHGTLRQVRPPRAVFRGMRGRAGLVDQNPPGPIADVYAAVPDAFDIDILPHPVRPYQYL